MLTPPSESNMFKVGQIFLQDATRAKNSGIQFMLECLQTFTSSQESVQNSTKELSKIVQVLSVITSNLQKPDVQYLNLKYQLLS